MENISVEEIEELLSNSETYKLGFKILESLGYRFRSIKLGPSGSIIKGVNLQLLTFIWERPRYGNPDFLRECGIRIYNDGSPLASCHKDVIN